MEQIFLAKRAPPQTYCEHLEAVYSAWRQVTEQHAGLIQRVCIAHEIDVNRFLKSSLLTVVFHDIGKMTVAFQDMMQAVDSAASAKALQRNFRHEYASFPFVAEAAVRLEKTAGPLLSSFPNTCLEALIVLGHHKPVDAELTSFDREIAFSGSLNWVKNGPEHAMEVAQILFKKRGWKLPEVFLDKCTKKVSANIITNLLLQRLPKNGQEIRPLFSLLKSLLIVPDWWASATPNPTAVTVKSRVEISKVSMRDSIRSEIEATGKPFEGWRPFQEQCAESSNHVIVVAPTGSGKTEAALLWACKQIESGKVSKLLYLLPTMINRQFDS